MATIKEIMYFDKPDRANSDEMVVFAKKRMDDLGIRNAVIVYGSGYTMTKFREVTKGETGLNVIAVANPSPHSPTRGAFPIVIRDTDSPEVRKRKEEQLAQGITEISATISDETREELEKEGIKVRYLEDYFILREPLNDTNATRRDVLAQFGFSRHLRPLDINTGCDLSIFTTISQGFRVCVGCTVLCVKSGLIEEGDLTLAIGGTATGLILRASADARTCLIKEIIGFERGSSWFEKGGEME
ncbi:hypothetical protein ACFLTB_00775 [Chloroflexota bacterium]